MPNFTTHLQLEKPTPEDFYDVEVLNKNWDKIDEELPKRVPQTRKINNKPLSADVTLTGEDIPAGAEDEKTLSSHLAECKNALDDKVTRAGESVPLGTNILSLAPGRYSVDELPDPETANKMNLPVTTWHYEIDVIAAANSAGLINNYKIIIVYPNSTMVLPYINLMNYSGKWTGWARIATATPPEEIPLQLAAGITHHNPGTKSTISRSQEGLVVVHFFCTKVDGSDMGSGEVIATLPEGFRPSTNVHIPASVSLDGTTFTDTALAVAGSNSYIWLAYPPAGCKVVTATLVFYARY